METKKHFVRTKVLKNETEEKEKKITKNKKMKQRQK